MSERVTMAALLELVGGDDELILQLCELGHLERDADDYGPDEVEMVLVCQTLVRELDVNWAGVDVALGLRRQLLEARRALSELAHRLDHGG